MDEVQNWDSFKEEYEKYFDENEIDKELPPDGIAVDINNILVDNPKYFDKKAKEIHIFLGKKLLEKGNSATVEEMDNGLLLFWAIFYEKDREFIKGILDKGVEVNEEIFDPDEDYISTPLFLAIRKINIEAVELLLSAKEIKVKFALLFAFEQLVDEENIHNEFQGYFEEIIKLLLKHPQIEKNLARDGKTPIYLAIESDSFTIFDLLIKDPKINLYQNPNFLPLKKIIEQYLDDMRYLELFLEFHGDEIYEDALIDAVWYDNIEALKLLLENSNWKIVIRPQTSSLQLMERTALLCNDGTAGSKLPMLPNEMMQLIFNLFPVVESKIYTFDFNSSFFLKFSENLFEDFLSIAAAQCKKKMVKIILDHVLKKKCLFIRGLLSISHKLKDMKAFQDKEIREAQEKIRKASQLLPLTYTVAGLDNAWILLRNLNILSIEGREVYQDREEKFNAIMEMIEKVKEELSYCGLAI